MARLRTHLFALLGLVLTACGSGTVTTGEIATPNAQTSSTEAPAADESTSSTSQATAAEATTTTPAEMFDLPSAELTNMATGETVNLTSVADGKPLVLWFWAPH